MVTIVAKRRLGLRQPVPMRSMARIGASALRWDQMPRVLFLRRRDGAEVGFVCRCNEAATGTERRGQAVRAEVARGEGPAHIRDGDGRALWPAAME